MTCYHCVCKTDCVNNNNGDQQRECPIQYDSCVTRRGPESRFAKLCGKRPMGNTDDVTDGYFPGEKYHWCNDDLCNGDSATGGGERQGKRLNLGSIILVAFSVGMLLVRLGICLKPGGNGRNGRARANRPRPSPTP